MSCTYISNHLVCVLTFKLIVERQILYPTELHAHDGAPSGARTLDLLIKSQLLYQLSQGRIGWEPKTRIFTEEHSLDDCSLS